MPTAAANNSSYRWAGLPAMLISFDAASALELLAAKPMDAGKTAYFRGDCVLARVAASHMPFIVGWRAPGEPCQVMQVAEGTSAGTDFDGARFDAGKSARK